MVALTGITALGERDQVTENSEGGCTKSGGHLSGEEAVKDGDSWE